MSFPGGFRGAMVGALSLLMLAPTWSSASEVKVGTWKTAQTIQPFFIEKFYPQSTRVEVFSFTNPADAGRCIIRFHLGKDVAKGLKRLLGAV